MKSLLFILGLFLMACGHETKPDPTTTTETAVETKTEMVAAAPDSFAVGTVLPSVALKQDSSQHFALYLPKDYNSQKKYPLIIFFDPQGAGEFPVQLYHELANSYQVILAGSNNCKNGLSFEQTSQIANNLVGDLMNRLPVAGITLAGHSGGAKVALMCGASNSQVSTVIYSGAATAVTPNHPFMLIGFGGRKDMNYTDLVSFEWSLQQSRLQHYFFEWGGPHEFPPAAIFKDAFEVITKGSVTKDASKQITITPEKVEEEQRIKQEYINAFAQKDLGWWKTEVARLNKLKAKDMMYERLLGFISLACYSFVSRALQQNDLATARQSLELYKLADPANKSIPGFEAELTLKSGK